MITRRVRTLLDRALCGFALGTLEEELGLFPTATLAVRTGVTGHFVVSFGSDSTPLWRAASVVGYWGDICDRADLKASGLKRTDRGLAA